MEGYSEILEKAYHADETKQQEEADRAERKAYNDNMAKSMKGFKDDEASWDARDADIKAMGGEGRNGTYDWSPATDLNGGRQSPEPFSSRERRDRSAATGNYYEALKKAKDDYSAYRQRMNTSDYQAQLEKAKKEYDDYTHRMVTPEYTEQVNKAKKEYDSYRNDPFDTSYFDSGYGVNDKKFREN